MRDRIEFRTRCVRPDGTVVDGHVTGTRTVVDDTPMLLVQLSDATTRLAAVAEMGAAQDRFRALTRRLTDAVYWLQLRPEPTFRFVNGATAAMTGYTADEIHADPAVRHRIVHPDDRHLVVEPVAGAPEPEPVLVRWVARDGTVRWVQQHQSVLAVAGGHVTDVLCVARDVTLQVETDRAWARHSAQRDAVTALALIGITTDDPGIVLKEAVATVDRFMTADLTAVWWETGPGDAFRLAAGAGFTDMEVGHALVDAVDSHAARVRDDQACTSFDNSIAIASLCIGGELAGEDVTSGAGVSILSGGRAVGALAVYFHGSASVDPQDVLFLQAVANTLGASADHAAFAEHLHDLSLRDPLTGLLNRTALVDELARSLDSAGQDTLVAVAVCGVDDFRLLSEAVGSDAADRALIEVATRLQPVAGPGSAIARSGSEFAFIIPRPDRMDSLDDVAAAVMATFVPPVAIGADPFTVTMSMGLAVGTRGDDADEVLSDALMALHDAQHRGRSQWMHAAEHGNTRALRRLDLTSGLRGAVEREEIRAHFQPIIDLRDGDVVGYEALARWERSKGDTVPPEEFIAIAEDTGFINDIGLSMLDQACDFLEAERVTHPGRALQITVNVSSRQLDEPDFPRRVEEVLAGHTVPRLAICLELTESAVVPGDQRMLDRLNALKRLGVTLAIDDFGTGYSSFAYLSQLPIDLLKLDRTFVTGLQDDPRRIAVVSSIISLASALGIEVLAEGVETSQERDVLAELDCGLAQGYLWGRPVSAQDAHAG
jgi:diguanylate cyclase (GGDEF)-like protein/PAS domain S-box-containing protein